jgi:8-oxo-dGTP diphosphatase
VSTLGESPAPVRAAGCAVWRRTDDGVLQTAMVHRPKYDDWSLPKGKPEGDEHLLQTAHREVAEETGLQVVVGRRSVSTRYDVHLPDGRPVPKLVDYWTGQWAGGDFRANSEVDELRWLPLNDATALCSHEHDRAVLADLTRTDVPLAPALLLVRHARAGSRSKWDGPDDLRPLDKKGRAQAQRLAEVLPVFAPTAVLSARRTRCEETAAPLAELLGLGVQPLDELGEEEFDADPDAGMAVLERLLEPRRTPGVTVVCSQGGAIPAALLNLGVRWEDPTEAAADRMFPPAAKGSVWALGGRPGKLSADYYRDFAGSADGSQG